MRPIEILVEVGRRLMVGGQEDLIVDVTLNLLAQRKKGLNPWRSRT
ncbi:hypothetical protein [Hyalangium rubrum]